MPRRLMRVAVLVFVVVCASDARAQFPPYDPTKPIVRDFPIPAAPALPPGSVRGHWGHPPRPRPEPRRR